MTQTNRPDHPSYDIGIHGGTLAGIAAALELKARGFRVWLSSHRTYLGEDLCDPLRLMVPGDLQPEGEALQRLFPDEVVEQGWFRPMALKGELDQLMAEAGIPVFSGSAPGELFVDESGSVCGISLCDRSGRRVLGCRVLVDATVQGDLLRVGNVPLTSPAGEVQVCRRVIGGEPMGEDSGWIAEGTVSLEKGEATLWAHYSKRTLAGPDWSDWMDLEQRVRMDAYRKGQLYSADGIEAFTGERMQPGVDPVHTEKLPDDAYTALNGRLWVLGVAANIMDEQRAALRRSDKAWAWGTKLAKRLAEQVPEKSTGGEWRSLSPCTITEDVQVSDVALPEGSLPGNAGAVSACVNMDVLVTGGGTGGAPAGISAARTGSRTLVAEFLSGLGGVGTLGLIGKYWYGIQEGFTAEVDEGARSLTNREFAKDAWDVEAKMQWYHRELTKAGGKIWYKTQISGALTRGNRVVGSVLATPRGRIAVLARCTVDATGSAAVAAAAGADTVPVGDGHLAMQGTGLPGRDPGKDYTNTDYEFVDDSNAADHASAHVTARKKFKAAFDAGQLVDSRERRRVVGDIEISPMDIRLSRVFPDTICRARSNFDTHGFTVHPLFLLVDPGHDPVSAHIPLRALTPKGLEGILVTGLGISAHRDAMPVIRMQADVQNQGFAAGWIAARAPEGRVREVERANYQRFLVEQGVLTPELFEPADSFPLPAEVISATLQASVDEPNLVDQVFTLPREECLGALHDAFKEAETEKAKRHFAFALGVLGDATGVEVLSEEVETTPWDKGWNYTGMGQFGASMSALDARIIALGRCRRSSSLPVLVNKALSLPGDAEFSHYRALSEAFATLGCPDAAPVLESLLQRPGIRGHAVTDVNARLKTATADSNETSFRNAALIEISLAGALFTLKPDSALARETLEAYARDVRGLFSKYAGSALGIL